MEYSIRELANLAGVSTRTLRWYDQIGLLKPSRTGDNGYRYYAAAEVNRLQHILFYRALGVELSQIQQLLDDPSFDRMTALREHLSALQARRAHIDALIDTVQRTLSAEERMIPMSDHEKFESFKHQLVAENEQAYGQEARARYGDGAVEAGNAKLLNMTQAQHAQWTALEQDIRAKLESAVRSKEQPDGPLGAEIADLHRRWLMFVWTKYTPQAHAGVAQMYVCDDRFRSYYDASVPGCAQFLRDAILCATKSL